MLKRRSLCSLGDIMCIDFWEAVGFVAIGTVTGYFIGMFVYYHLYGDHT